MSIAELEKVTKAGPPISRAVRVPHTEADYRELVELLDRVTDEVGEDENHPSLRWGPHPETRGRACRGADRIIYFNEVETNAAALSCAETLGVWIVQTSTTRLGGQEDACRPAPRYWAGATN